KSSAYPSTLDVAGMGGTISDVNVTLSGVSLTATNLDLLLVAPDGTHATLISSDVPTAGVVSQNWTYDDEAAAPQENGLTGRFKPVSDGAKNATLVLGTDTGAPALQIPLSGLGLAVPVNEQQQQAPGGRQGVPPGSTQTGSSDVGVQTVRFDGPTTVGQPTTLH